MNALSVFEYQNPRQFLLDSFARRQKADPSFSVRSLARAMGISHSLLILLLKNKRPLRSKHAPAISRGLRMPAAEQLYLQALIQFEAAATHEDRQVVAVWLADLHPGKSFRSLEFDRFQLVSHWVHMALLSMAELRDFDGTAEQATARLRGKVSLHEVRAAIERLLALGLLQKQADGRLRPTYDSVTSKNDAPDKGACAYHQSVSELARQAVVEQGAQAREFQAFSLATKRDKVPLAKELIRKFRLQFVNAVGVAGDGDDVYQMNIQFFQLTESPDRELARTEDEGAAPGSLVDERKQK
jgi:uncharacterized protein (TIGR02147 family)